MGLRCTDWPPDVLALLRTGRRHPGASAGAECRAQARSRAASAALTRYYLDAGSGGLAVGVHTTQFAIREAGLYRAGAGARRANGGEWTRRPVVMIAGVVGRTEQAIQEAQLARGLGYHAGLLSLAAMKGADEDELIAHCAAVAREIPLVGFYLQPAVGGIVLPMSFWRRFAAIENVVAIKIAPFNRYRTLDVVRGVVEAGAADRVDALHRQRRPHRARPGDALRRRRISGAVVTVRIKGGLLGHWSVWVHKAVELLDQAHRPRRPTRCRPICSRSTRR